VQVSEAAKKTQNAVIENAFIENAVILSEAKNLSFFPQLEERFFASLRMTKQGIFSAPACLDSTRHGNRNLTR
jgi:hypothetical protein